MIKARFENINENSTDFSSLFGKDENNFFSFPEDSVNYYNEPIDQILPLNTLPRPQDIITRENEFHTNESNIINNLEANKNNKNIILFNLSNDKEKDSSSIQKPQNIKTNKNNEKKSMRKEVLRVPKIKKVRTKKKIIKIKYFEIKKISKLKAGNNIKKKSKRNLNIYNMIIRNLIQDIFLNWINEGEKKNKKLKKLNPKVLKSYNFKGSLLKDIYSQEITKSEKDDKKYNINIINNVTGIKKIKLNLSFENSLILFYNDDINKNEFNELLLHLKQEKINMTDFLKGLKTKNIYAKEKWGKEKFQEKLNDNLNKIKDDYLPDKENN